MNSFKASKNQKMNNRKEEAHSVSVLPPRPFPFHAWRPCLGFNGEETIM